MTMYQEVPGYPSYRVGDDGSVWTRWARCPRGGFGTGFRTYLGDTWKTVNPWIRAGYRSVQLYVGDGVSKRLNVAPLALMAFIGPCPLGSEACHENGNRTDDRLCNLRWDTRKANASDRVRHGTQIHGERHKLAKLDRGQVREIRLDRAAGRCYRDIATRFQVSKTLVFRVCRGLAWRRVVECDEAQADVAVAWVKAAMIDGMVPLIAPIPVEVEASIGKTWGG